MLRCGLYYINCFWKKQIPNPENLVIAEVGVFKGENALEILKNIKNIKKMYLIDNDRGCPDTCKNVFTNYLDKIEWVIEDSTKAAGFFPDETFDLVYIDADHQYQAVVNDINAWYPKVKKNGFLIGHDYGNEVEPVMRAVQDTLKDFWIKGEWFKQK